MAGLCAGSGAAGRVSPGQGAQGGTEVSLGCLAEVAGTGRWRVEPSLKICRAVQGVPLHSPCWCPCERVCMGQGTSQRGDAQHRFMAPSAASQTGSDFCLSPRLLLDSRSHRGCHEPGKIVLSHPS